MADSAQSSSKSKAPSLVRYEARWAATALHLDLRDMADVREDLVGSLEILERLAEGAVAPWTEDVIGAVQAISDGFSALDRAVDRAMRWAG